MHDLIAHIFHLYRTAPIRKRSAPPVMPADCACGAFPGLRLLVEEFLGDRERPQLPAFHDCRICDD